MSEHTPGPWKVQKYRNRPSSPWLTYVVGESEQVAHVLPTGDGIGGERWGEETCEANAQLIAAAPDLLESLRAMLEAIDTMDNLDEVVGDLIPKRAYLRAWDAVERASGRLEVTP